MSSRFDHLHVRGFRRLHDFDIKLKPLCVMIGANGCGKTSLLDVFSVLSAGASGRLNDTLGEMSGIAANLTANRADSLSFQLSMSVSGRPNLDYHLKLQPSGVSYEIVEESLTELRNLQPPPFKYIESRRGDIRYFDETKKLMRPTWEHNPLETSLAQVPKMFKEPEEFRQRLASSTHYHVLDVSRRAPVRLPQPLRPASLPGSDGEDIVSCLFALRETDRGRYDLIEETVRAGFPDFERFDFPPVAAGTLGMTWKEKAFTRPLNMHQLSEGTLRFLWLVTLLQSPGLTAVTLIDEPEVSLHPELLSLLAGLLREASSRTQIVVATHADRLVRFLNPDEIVAMDMDDDGATRASWGDELELDSWLEEYTLDEVWRLGRMGGRS